MSSIEFRKELFADERDDDLNEVGKPTQRQDILGHVTGRSPYFDDHLFDGLLHLKCVRSPHHHAACSIHRHICGGIDARRGPGHSTGGCAGQSEYNAVDHRLWQRR